MSEHFFIYNKNFYRENTPVWSNSDRSLLYGDGLFETMRLHQNVLINKSLHFDRFFSGLHELKIALTSEFTEDYFTKNIVDLLIKNKISKNARVRLMAFRKEDNAKQTIDTGFNYMIEAWKMEEAISMNKQGLRIDIFNAAHKSSGKLSNIKSNNYLVSIMAGLFSKENNLDECLILNSAGRVCESAKANVFIINKNIIYTPPLSEGCVAGIIRKWILENLTIHSFQIIQKEITLEDLDEAEEIFLTNSIQPVRWVQTFRHKYYTQKVTEKIAAYIHANMHKPQRSNY